MARKKSLVHLGNFGSLRAVLALAIFIFVLSMQSHAQAQALLQSLEPGMGYARFKQWAIENRLVFEQFTKDALIVRDTGVDTWERLRIQVRFCAGDDYSGKASSIIIQQLFKPEIDVAVLQRDYVEVLSGKASAEGKFSGAFSVRRDRKDGNGDGLAIAQDAGEKGFWEVGVFKKTAGNNTFGLLQTVRRRDSICQ